MSTIAIIQPARIGDIIICLPIAKYFADKGHKVLWPISSAFYKMFVSVVEYAEFWAVSDDINFCVRDALQVARRFNVDQIINLSFGFYTMEKLGEQWGASGLTFDAFKYQLAGVPFEEKWNLKINRNLQDEQNVFNNVVKSSKYMVCHIQTSRGCGLERLKLQEPMSNYQIIHVDKDQDGITGVFSWLTVLEKASKVVLSNSSFLNLTNQLNVGESNRIFMKNCPNNKMTIEQPVLKGKWEII